MENFCTVYYKSAPGLMEISGDDEGIISLYFTEKKSGRKKSNPGKIPVPLKKCLRQLDEYFAGRRKNFELLLKPEGTWFQKKVWKQLLKIPFGKTMSYGEIAARTGNSKASRAVGNANNKNKIAVIIPCHRVIGSKGDLTGYAGGLKKKKWLLEHEKGFC
ncbi:MAG: methylated-DNA--[protein]-cysteine S-methyltransferase [Ignavibacteria bacterium]|nr:methylated-DNA--[protein]-cysteine S-methyltransferase [Ignavibacteria bacterium]